ncbi:MAG: hypothetical protein K6360_00515 [Deltaproteobacteria bacterium]
MHIDALKPNITVHGPLFPEPVQVIVAIPMGASVKLGGGLRWGEIPDDATLPDRNQVEVVLLEQALNPLLKVEHYRLKADSIRHPVELHENRAAYTLTGQGHPSEER